MHVKKSIDSDRFHDNRVHKWGPTITTGFTKAEERAWHRAGKDTGTLGNG